MTHDRNRLMSAGEGAPCTFIDQELNRLLPSMPIQRWYRAVRFTPSTIAGPPNAKQYQNEATLSRGGELIRWYRPLRNQTPTPIFSASHGCEPGGTRTLSQAIALTNLSLTSSFLILYWMTGSEILGSCLSRNAAGENKSSLKSTAR